MSLLNYYYYYYIIIIVIAIRLSLEESKTTNNSTVSMYPSFSPPQQNKKEVHTCNVHVLVYVHVYMLA